MARLKKIASKALMSVNRITSLPVVLVMKAFSAIGITKAITRVAQKAIRRDRLILASIILVSLELTFLFIVGILIPLVFNRADTWMAAVVPAMRIALILLTAGSILYFRYRKVATRHHEGAEIRAIARYRRK